MVHIGLINKMIESEKRLELFEEGRKNHRSEPVVNYLAAPQSWSKEKPHQEKRRNSADLVRTWTDIINLLNHSEREKFREILDEN